MAFAQASWDPEQQINIVSSFIDDFGAGETVVMVDPVMGDEGRPYATYTPAMCEGMRNLDCQGRYNHPQPHRGMYFSQSSL